MKKRLLPCVCIAGMLLAFFTGFSQNSNGPIGWASLNGGTTGGAGGEIVRPASRNALANYLSAPDPYVIIVEDTIVLTRYERLDVTSNKTIFGLGDNATLLEGGLEIKGNNVIVQNLRITGSYDGDWDGKTHSTDAITITGSNVWVDHCDLSASADGLLDIRSGNNSTGDYVTISWVRFSNHNKVMLFGSSDSEIANRGKLRITIHHCWFDGLPERGVNQRNPRIRFGDVHLFNNFYDDVDFYCIGARFESDVVVESNYFRNSRDPHFIGDIGKGEKAPSLVAINNIYEFSSGTRSERGSAFNPGDFYEYETDDPELLPTMVMNGAGLMNTNSNEAPVAVPDTFFREEGAPRAFNIDALANDGDADGGDLRISNIINTPRGLGRIQNNTITYVGPTDQTGTDTLRYELIDTQGGLDTGLILIQFATVTDLRNVNQRASALTIAPNPIINQAFAVYDAIGEGPLEAQVVDLYGRTYPRVIQRPERSTTREQISWDLHTQSLAAGTYVLTVREGQSLTTKPFTVL